MKTLRAGVTRLREEVAALLGTEVVEVSGTSQPPEGTDGNDGTKAPVLMGTEAVLHRVRRASAVVFLDIDLHLLAPRFSATDETLALLARAARLVGPRHGGPVSARIMLQTRVPDHAVLRAVVRGNPAAVMPEEEQIRRDSGLPPFSALAVVSGSHSGDYIEVLQGSAAAARLTTSELSADRYLVRADDHDALCDALAAAARPPGRGLRIEVDPRAL
jgi:primosomal protein N' (replication factor Y)